MMTPIEELQEQVAKSDDFCRALVKLAKKMFADPEFCAGFEKWKREQGVKETGGKKI